MAIQLTPEQVEKLKAHKFVPWRPRYSRIVHIHILDEPHWGSWTCCNEMRPDQSAEKPFDWSDPFCARCVKAALK